MRGPSDRWCRTGLGACADEIRQYGAGSPRLVRVREPDQLGVERAHPQLAFGARLVELAEANRDVAADDSRTLARLDDDHLHTARVARRRDEPELGQQLELAVDRHVLQAGRVDPRGSSTIPTRACWSTPA